jgi:hypothetical protein
MVPTVNLLVIVRARRGTFPVSRRISSEARGVRRWRAKPAGANLLHHKSIAVADRPKSNFICQRYAPAMLSETGLNQVQAADWSVSGEGSRPYAPRSSPALQATVVRSFVMLRRGENNQRGLHVSQSQRGPANTAFQTIPRRAPFRGGAGGLQAEQKKNSG